MCVRSFISNVFRIAIKDLEILMFQFLDFGKNLPKSQKISPDSFYQLAFQLAYFK